MAEAAREQLLRFREAVQRRVADSPYALTPTATGFDLGIDLVDPGWVGLFRAAGLQRTFVHHVEVGASTYSVTDDRYCLRWDADRLRLCSVWERSVDRQVPVVEVTSAPVDPDRWEQVIGYTFSAQEGRAIITDTARELGLRQRQPAAVMATLVLAVVVLVLAAGGLLTAALR